MRKTEGQELVVELGDLTPKQKLFCQTRNRYVAYGGARGGGKTHVSRVKALGGALAIPGLRILFVRREYPELEQTAILPMRRMIPEGVGSYNGALRMFFFPNGSVIKFGHFGAGDQEEYQGQEWDWIFLDEATQFTEQQFLVLGACLRGSSEVPRRMYLTCNPGGIGHLWVKRLFVDRDFRNGEKPEDYAFIPATIEDNPHLLRSSPEYVRQLELLPEDVRRAWRYGDWDALAGSFFPEFRREVHVVPPLTDIPRGWKRYRAFDYGLDMLACLWVARDPKGKSYVYREVQAPGLIVSQAAQLMRQMTPPGEDIAANIGPPDMWSTQKDTGRTMAELFGENGVPLLRAGNQRVQGWMAVKELLRDGPEGPGLVVGADCAGLIRNLPALQHDKENPSDCATEPHAITHICDALRYYAVTRTVDGEAAKPPEPFPGAVLPEFQELLCGGEAGEDYLFY